LGDTGGDSVVVIDCETNTIVGSIQTEGPYVLRYLPDRDWVASASWRFAPRQGVSIIDCGPDTIRSFIETGVEHHALEYSSLTSKLYGASSVNDVTTVLDVEGDSVLAAIEGGLDPGLMSFNPVENKLYVGGYYDSAVAVLDASTYEVAAKVYSEPVRYMVFNPVANKLYHAGGFTSIAPHLRVLDGAGDSSMGLIPVGRPSDLACNLRENTLYCASASLDSVKVIDCETDTVFAAVVLERPWRICYNSAANKAYCAGQFGGLTIIDGPTHRILVTLPGDYSEFCPVPERNRVYSGQRQLRIIDGRGDSILSAHPEAGENLDYIAGLDRLYCTEHDTLGQGTLYAHDLETGVRIDSIRFDGEIADISCNRTGVYVAEAERNRVTFVDGVTNRVVTRLPVGAGLVDLEWDSLGGRTFASCRGSLTVTAIRDPDGIGQQEAVGRPARGGPTVARASLVLPGKQGTLLLDIAGRRVMELLPGENDVRGVAPGVYFVRSAEGGERPAVTKVVITK
jgi:YVTN family beta-propeller protein